MHKITWMRHALLDGHGVLPGPLCHLLLHLDNLGRVHGPEAALPLVGAVGGRLLDLLEALVQAEVVPDRVLPAGGGSLEVGEVLAK